MLRLRGGVKDPKDCPCDDCPSETRPCDDCPCDGCPCDDSKKETEATKSK